MPDLFSPLDLRGVRLPNRIGISPMCMYSAVDGHPTRWHLIHLGARAVGGAGLVMAEATAVTPEGRITPGCTGLWDDAQVGSWRPVVDAIADAGAVPGIQLGHAGRKAGTSVPWEGDAPLDRAVHPWQAVAPSPIAFHDGFDVPVELDQAGIDAVVAAFATAARRALAAGFRVVEVHAAHGYLLHSFLSPIANRRADGYGGDLAARARLLREVARAVRGTVGEAVPVAVRVSATDWLDGSDGRVGLTLEETARVAGWLAEDGVDLVDCSSGGIVRGVAIPTGPGYQVPLAARVREAGVATAAVGQITDPAQAAAIIDEGRADLVLLGRAALREPNWALRAARELGRPGGVRVPVQYRTAW